jgi:hypothetical protein
LGSDTNIHAKHPTGTHEGRWILDSDPNFAGSEVTRSSIPGRLLTVTSEQTGDYGEVAVTLSEKVGLIHADLSVGANVTSAVALLANGGVSSPGVKLHGAGFIVTPDEASALGSGTVPGLERHIRDYRNGRDLTDAPRGVKVIDAFGLTAEQLREQYPAVYQRLLDRVKPERDAKGSSKDGAGYAKFWWLHGKPRPEMRKQLATLPRYIATVETAKHRTFQFLDASILPDNKLIAIALSAAFHLGVLSSRLHGAWALAAGSTLEDRPVYVKTTCFETFPFPDDSTGLTPELRETITTLAEQIDAHRKRVLESTHQPACTVPTISPTLEVGQSGADGADLVSAASMRPQPSPAAPLPAGTSKGKDKLTLTGLYNVLEALREQRPLTAKERTIHTQGLVGVLKELHDELDGAVLQAYGLSVSTSTDDILSHLVALSQQRAAEETQGTVRWLRPEFQNPQISASESLLKTELPAHIPRGLQGDLIPEAVVSDGDGDSSSAFAPQPAKLGSEPAPEGLGSDPKFATPRALENSVQTTPWPATLPEQVRAVVQALASSAAPLTLTQIEARFKGKGGWKKGLPALLETLEALGRAQRSVGGDAGDGASWRA